VLDSDRSVTANFDFVPQQTLTVTPFIELPSGQFFGDATVSARVFSDPPGIDCYMQSSFIPPGTCSAQFPTFSDVVLHFEALNSSTVTNQLCGTLINSTCSIHMDRPRETLAVPQINFLHVGGVGECSQTANVDVTVTTPTGAFSPNNCDRDGFDREGFYILPVGTPVTLTYTSPDPYEWSGAGDLCVPTTVNPCSFTLDRPVALSIRRVP
jgi:hypothetical protein